MSLSSEKQGIQKKASIWQDFHVDIPDIEFIYNWLLEKEAPQTLQSITTALAENRIGQKKAAIQKKNKSLHVFRPAETYETGDHLTFSYFDMQEGKVVSKRSGSNPDHGNFEIIAVEFTDGEQREFATGIEDHILNEFSLMDENDPDLDPEMVIQTHGDRLMEATHQQIVASGSFVNIAEQWFPEALLVDINAGHLNLAEAVLDFTGDTPVSTADMIEQIGLKDSNQALLEFSLNIALQKDPRFDEVGPSGDILWYLTSREPKEINEHPPVLQSILIDESAKNEIDDMLTMFEGMIADEYEVNTTKGDDHKDELTFSLIFPHWVSGTLPLTPELKDFFPTSIETPHIRFKFIDGQNRKEFAGWVAKPFNFVAGLKAWYQKVGLLPGSLIHIKKGKNPGEIIIRPEKKRPAREWIRVVDFNQQNQISFSMQMELINAGYHDRMLFGIANEQALLDHWVTTPTAQFFEKTVHHLMRELMKLNPQGHVHGQELYAATNLVMRCPPRTLLTLLEKVKWVEHTGDLYYRLIDGAKER
jgi:antitoxin component of MazEF toxin-antitoxin module